MVNNGQKTVVVITNDHAWTYNLRRELLKELLDTGYRVILLLAYGKKVDDLIAMGCEFIEVPFDRHGKNPFSELKLLLTYRRILKEIAPDAVLTYTIKPNVYGGMACAMMRIPFVMNVTGLGGAVENGGLMQKITLALYWLGTRRAQKVFFQNCENQRFMIDHGIRGYACDLLPGSGVNLERHRLEAYPENDGKIVLLVIGRVMRDKGSDEILQAAKIIKQRYPNVMFRLLGFCDGDYQEKLDVAVRNGYIEYLGMQDDVHAFIKDSHATVHASYHEGMANVLLETAAAGRPVIATDIPGCREAFDDGVSGLSCAAKDVGSLVAAIEKFIELPYEAKAQMGLAGRRKMEREFDRSIIVEKYMQELNKIQTTGR